MQSDVDRAAMALVQLSVFILLPITNLTSFVPYPARSKGVVSQSLYPIRSRTNQHAAHALLLPCAQGQRL
jgi:hypothetical protein